MDIKRYHKAFMELAVELLTRCQPIVSRRLEELSNYQQSVKQHTKATCTEIDAKVDSMKTLLFDLDTLLVQVSQE